MAEYIDRDDVFIAGDEAYLDYSVATLTISAAIETTAKNAVSGFYGRMNNGVKTDL